MIEPITEGFVIDDDIKADWAVKKIKEEEAERDRLIKLANDQISELEMTIERLTKECADSTSYLRFMLARYFETVERKQTKTQESYKLLNGSLVRRKPKQSITKPEDMTELTKYLQENKPEMVSTQVNVNWGEFKKTLSIVNDTVVDENGEVLDMITVSTSEEEFIIK